MDNIDLILYNHGLRKTIFRKELLNLFYNTKSSLTHEEIKNKIGNKGNKVTIYRALEAFERNGLIHRVPDKNNLSRYAICNKNCDSNSNEHIQNHAHFICNDCHQTFCIDEIEVPSFKNLSGFNIQKSNITLEGKCPSCKI